MLLSRFAGQALGRSHRRIETEYEIRSEKVCCEKSADAIVPNGNELQ